MRVTDALEGFFSGSVALDANDCVVVAFSGGPDSTALLWALHAWSPSRGIRLLAAHLDHGTDPGSESRACRAARIARELGVPFISDRRPVPAARRSGESLEEAARRIRYGFLEEVRLDRSARWIATAHHADDQAETVLLRLLQGSGAEGLAGIRPVRGSVVRPLLDLPRRCLLEALEGSPLGSVEDPTNRDLRFARNRVRHRLLPHLTAEDPELPRRLASIADRARGARSRLDSFFAQRLDLRPEGNGLSVAWAPFEALPPPLRSAGLAWLHRQAGALHPPGRAARQELGRQIAAARETGTDIGCDGGEGWHWRRRGSRFLVERAAGTGDLNRAAGFTYTLEVPGEIVVKEISSRIRLAPGTLEPWMFRSSTHRAGLALPLDAGDRVEIRTRRPGDRLHPLGAPGRRRLKEVLIDRRIPREDRDRLPLLVVDDRIAWVPGVTLDERFRLREGGPVWNAEILPL